MKPVKKNHTRFPWLLPLLLVLPLLAAGVYVCLRWGGTVCDLVRVALKMAVRA